MQFSEIRHAYFRDGFLLKHLMLSVPIREATLHPIDKIFLCQLTIHTFVSLGHSLILPLFKIILKKGMSLNSGRISLLYSVE